jgi:hypothetical protein
MPIHYKSRNHYRYPRAACGRDSMGSICSINLIEVDCQNCIKSLNETTSTKMSMRDHERNQIEHRMDGKERLW